MPESPAISHNERRPEAFIQRLKTDFLALFPFQLTQNSNIGNNVRHIICPKEVKFRVNNCSEPIRTP